MKYSLIILSFLMSFLSFSQDNVKKNIYKGNIFYHDSEFEDAVYYYEKAVSESDFNFKANFNLANAYIRIKDFDKAIETYEKIAEYSNSNTKKAKIYHNIGNAYMFSLNPKDSTEKLKTDEVLEKLDNAIESYKTALRVNPNDEETRYNLAYALLLKKKQEQQKKQEQKENKENKDDKDKKDSDDKKDGDQKDSDDQKDGDKSDKEKKDGDKDKEGDKSDEEKDKNNDKEKDKSDEGKDKDSDKKNENKDNNGEPENRKGKQPKISKSQAQRILDEAQKAEKDIQDKLNKRKVLVGEKGKPTPKKDW